MSLENIKHVHFIGVGGIGMSALARLFLHEGKTVSGSDSVKSELTEKLKAEGVAIEYDHDHTTIYDSVNEIDLVVYSEAVKPDNPERIAAKEKGIKTINYFEALGLVANQYYLIAVSGSHGKSTTTSMLIDILEEAGLDPSAVVGTLRSESGSNYRAGKSKYFVAEACEYKRDFMTLEPDVLVITNIELEHVDFYKNLEEVQKAFRDFADKVPEDGVVIADVNDETVVPVVADLKAEVIDYKRSFDPMLELKQPGLHNQFNAAAARAAAGYLGVADDVSKTALENFAGTWRRFEYKGEVNGAPLYDDYAHHPTAIEAVIAGAREKYPDKKLTVVFQSHTYSRTGKFFNEFAEALAKADRVLMLPIYTARKENVPGVDAEKLAKAVVERGTPTEYCDSLDTAASTLKNSVDSNEVVLLVGAGDITNLSKSLIK